MKVLRSRPKDPKDKSLWALQIHKIEAVTKVPAYTWTNRYREVLQRSIDEELVEGTLVDGYYIGDLGPQSPLWRLFPIVRWSWVRLIDGHIWDPNKWITESSMSYVYVGPPKHVAKCPPGYPPIPDRSQTSVILELGAYEVQKVREVLGYPPELWKNQLQWLRQELQTSAGLQKSFGPDDTKAFMDSTSFLEFQYGK